MTMTSDTDFFTITIRKRTGWFWGLAGLWLLLEVLFVQTALASVQEGEYRAATICWTVVCVLAAFGCFSWLRRRGPRKRGHSSGQQQEASISEPTSVSTVD
jgi:Na+/melibiose symporter-like transporter